MSCILRDKASVSISPLNTSTSKMMYSFPMLKRFIEYKNPICDKIYYPVIKNTQIPLAFSKDKRFRITDEKIKKTPSPQAYRNNKSSFSNIGYKFGHENKQNKNFKNQNKDIPGPGKYDIIKNISRGIHYSFRTKNVEEKYIHKNINPAPNAYEQLQSIIKKGKWQYSQYRNTPSTIISSGSKRFLQETVLTSKNNPGPGQYSMKSFIDMDDPKSFKFPKNNRIKKMNLMESSTNKELFHYNWVQIADTPGPGQYLLPSEWGVYVNKKYYDNSFEKKGIKKIRRKQDKPKKTISDNQKIYFEEHD